MLKKKIMFINHWAGLRGGAEISLFDIIKYTYSKADVLLVCSEDGELIQRASKIGIRTKVVYCPEQVSIFRRNGLLKKILGAPFPLLKFCQFICNVYNVVKKEKPDIIHANVPKSHITLCFLKMMGFKGRAVFHIREIFESGSFPWFLYNFLFPRSNSSIIAISQAVMKSLPKRLQKYAVVIYNGIDIKPLKKHDYKGHVRFLYLGRIVPWKGCHRIIRAFSVLFKRYGETCGTLDIRGGAFYWDESYKQELDRLIIQMHLERFVHILPFTDDTYSEFCSHDVLCMASDKEPFGRVAVEAQAAGLPVIGFASGGMEEVVQQNRTGFLVKQDDETAFAESMELFVRNRSRITEMGMEGHRFVSGNFNVDKQIPQIYDMISSQGSDAVVKVQSY